MTEERIRLLESVGFDWGTNYASWNALLEQLLEFEVEFGHYLVPQQYAANPKLGGGWVSHQRTQYKMYQEGKPSSMTAEHIRVLESVGFDWGTNYASWNALLEQLLEFKVQFGHCLVPQRYPANPKLGNWVSNQRSDYRMYQGGKPSSMTAERIRLLESVGFDWGTNNASWNTLLEQLAEYKVQFSHCLVPQRYPANPTLGKWVSHQRSHYKLYQGGKPSSMTAERIRVLESVGFDWAPVRQQMTGKLSTTSTVYLQIHSISTIFHDDHQLLVCRCYLSGQHVQTPTVTQPLLPGNT